MENIKRDNTRDKQYGVDFKQPKSNSVSILAGFIIAGLLISSSIVFVNVCASEQPVVVQMPEEFKTFLKQPVVVQTPEEFKTFLKDYKPPTTISVNIGDDAEAKTKFMWTLDKVGTFIDNLPAQLKEVFSEGFGKIANSVAKN